MDFALAAAQPAALDVSLAAPQVGDFWANEDAPDRVTGALQLSAQADYREGLGNGVVLDLRLRFAREEFVVRN